MGLYTASAAAGLRFTAIARRDTMAGEVMMYTTQNIEDVTRQLRKRTLLLLAPVMLLLAALALSFVSRVQWLSAALLSLMAIILIAGLHLFILPVRKYRDFLKAAAHGKTRRDELAFQAVEAVPVLREGIKVYPVMMLAEHTKEGLEERQYYYDANLPLPDWKRGERLALTSHERLITAWERLSL